jgi:glutaredoxin 3
MMGRMPVVQIYTKKLCPYCVRAKALLQKKGVSYQEIDVEGNDEIRVWLAEASGQKTVPQIFVDGRPLGGFAEIDALDREGKLDAALRSGP